MGQRERQTSIGEGRQISKKRSGVLLEATDLQVCAPTGTGVLESFEQACIVGMDKQTANSNAGIKQQSSCMIHTCWPDAAPGAPLPALLLPLLPAVPALLMPSCPAAAPAAAAAGSDDTAAAVPCAPLWKQNTWLIEGHDTRQEYLALSVDNA